MNTVRLNIVRQLNDALELCESRVLDDDWMTSFRGNEALSVLQPVLPILTTLCQPGKEQFLR